MTQTQVLQWGTSIGVLFLIIFVFILQSTVSNIEDQQQINTHQDSTYRWFVSGDAVFFVEQNGNAVLDSIYASRITPDASFFINNNYNISKNLYRTLESKIRALNVNDIMVVEKKDTLVVEEGIYYKQDNQILFVPNK